MAMCRQDRQSKYGYCVITILPCFQNKFQKPSRASGNTWIPFTCHPASGIQSKLYNPEQNTQA
ncbi:hypothetical protein DSO57_1020454 [Entomophthora muscae]|uniref:Uncharacterized protein n=1 Tax=Entomophthora muscae TaxID=34485 RepID=A0ACC2SGN1_9FUNG|nr:hypothetical protein DSO57_1020454 [Entomophthora muscae]